MIIPIEAPMKPLARTMSHDRRVAPHVHRLEPGPEEEIWFMRAAFGGVHDPQPHQRIHHGRAHAGQQPDRSEECSDPLGYHGSA